MEAPIRAGDPPPRVMLITDPATDEHAAPGHPERPERREAAVSGIQEGAAGAGALVVRAEVAPASDDAIGRVHPASHLAELVALVEKGGGWLDPDTYLAPGSMRAARLAAGASVQAAIAVAGGDAAVAFAAVRPPGHHASATRAGGFCLLNNVAIAAMELRSRGLARIAILDWDVHHGDGTQAIFDRDPDVVYASTHQFPLFPGTGTADDRGRAAGAGSMHNLPLPAGSGDEAFVAAWLGELLPAAEAFDPQAILVSAGYDAHRADPLANLEVTEAGYATVAQAVGGVAARLGLGGVALILEGGYDLPALRASIAETVRGLLTGLRGP